MALAMATASSSSSSSSFGLPHHHHHRHRHRRPFHNKVSVVLLPRPLVPPRASKFEAFQPQQRNPDAPTPSPFETDTDTITDGNGGASDMAQDDDMAGDSVLPLDLDDAVLQSSQSTSYFLSSGGTRAIVELLIPELENLDDDGAQQRLWDLGRLFLESVQANIGTQRLKAIFPDAGAAAMLQNRWGDATFSFGSLNDRRPVNDEDDVVVLVVPDYQMLGEVQKIATTLSGDGNSMERPLVMWNPRLFSGDVGIGLNVRRTQINFMSTFTVVYSIRPLPLGAIFRRYPGLWQIFLDDKDRPGRYIAAREQPSRPTPDELDLLVLGGEAAPDSENVSPLVNALGIFASFNRFMKSLSQ